MIKPLIGIGSDVLQSDHERDRAFGFLTYVEALRRAGAVPVLIPPQPENAGDVVGSLDGILLAGGADCDPLLYGEEPHPACRPMDTRRQANDLALARAAREAAVPALGICLGMQMMNVAWGGSLIQDIDSRIATDIQHASEPGARARHDVRIEPGTKLASLVRDLDHVVNSSHHQAVDRLGTGLRVNAKAADGVIEGLEDPDHPFYLGLQWHPEDMEGETTAVAIFAAFLDAARACATRKRAALDLLPAGNIAPE